MKRIKLRLIIMIAVILATVFACTKSENDAMYNNTQGKGGSLARMTIVGNYLYMVDVESINVFDITQKENPTYLRKISVGFGIETVWPYQDYLFIGSQTGMYIYSITDPSNPAYLGDFQHVMSCDPVVVNDSLAFVTLRSGSGCRVGENINQLNIIDITDVENPEEIITHSVDEPWGLAIEDNYLFICHGQYGLGVYSWDQNYNITEIKRISDIETYDLILDDPKMLVVGPSGFYQYDYSNIDSITLLSEIPLNE